MSYKVIDAPKEILHLQFDTRIAMTTCMCRIDSFSESPIPSLKNSKSPDWQKLIEAILCEQSDYFSFWEGFNIPGDKLAEFFSLYADHELSFFELDLKGLMASKKYLIATDINSTEATVEHELAHARWYVSSTYKELALKAVKAIPDEIRQVLKVGLMNYGYPNDDDVIEDEIHAYLLTSEKEELLEVFPQLPILDVLKLSEGLKKKILL